MSVSVSEDSNQLGHQKFMIFRIFTKCRVRILPDFQLAYFRKWNFWLLANWKNNLHFLQI